MKNKWLIYFAALACALSCTKDNISSYSIDNSAVVFESASFQYSMRGIKEDEVEINVPLVLIGPLADYSREVTVKVNTEEGFAVQGQDFSVLSASIPANSGSGSLTLKVKNLPDGVEQQMTKVEIVPNQYFRTGYPDRSISTVSWVDTYTRPTQLVWRSWHLFLSRHYSKRFHEFVLDVLGQEAEKSSHASIAAKEGLILRNVDWWYVANRLLREKVKEYDDAHPGDPLRHSRD